MSIRLIDSEGKMRFLDGEDRIPESNKIYEIKFKNGHEMICKFCSSDFEAVNIIDFTGTDWRFPISNIRYFREPKW
jgi:hypothetical protein